MSDVAQGSAAADGIAAGVPVAADGGPSDRDAAAADQLAAFIAAAGRLAVLTGAGCSTASGIPDYRDDVGVWKRKPPVTYQAFIGDDYVRRRYWARSLVGWPAFSRAEPNATHLALARLEHDGRLVGTITQNVDRLHQRAGSRHVIDLHGRLDQVMCLNCSHRLMRRSFQQTLADLNRAWAQRWITEQAAIAPDGDADLDNVAFADFVVPSCRRCGGVLKPDVVFFGESVPAERVKQSRAIIDEADAMLVVGSSLMVYSGYRFVRQAVERGLPVAALNLGVMRADAELSVKIQGRCEAVFANWLSRHA